MLMRANYGGGPVDDPVEVYTIRCRVSLMILLIAAKGVYNNSKLTRVRDELS